MGHVVIGVLMIATGLCATGVGVAVATNSLRSADRTYQRTTLRAAAHLEGWHVWFLHGFSGMTMGICWLYAVAAWLAWTLAGVCLIGLGIRLLGHL